MDELTALSILANAIDACLNNDLPAAEVFAALNFLAARASGEVAFRGISSRVGQRG